MNYLQLCGAIAVAALLCSLFSVAAASAATFSAAEWTERPNMMGMFKPIAAQLHVDWLGNLLFEDTKTPLGKAVIVCNLLLEGTITTKGEGLITKLWEPPEKEIKAPLVETGLICENRENCGEPLVWASNLPWNTLLNKMEVGVEKFFVDLLRSSGVGNPGWDVECMGTILKPSDLCLAEPEGITNTFASAPNVSAVFQDSFAELAELKLASCSLGGANTGITEGTLTISLTEGGELNGQ